MLVLYYNTIAATHNIAMHLLTINFVQLVISEVEDPEVVLSPGAKLWYKPKVVEAKVQTCDAVNALQEIGGGGGSVVYL